MPEHGNTWERLAGLPLRIERHTFEPLQALVSSEFERKSTVIHISGAGQEGIGEDVKTCKVGDHVILSWRTNCGTCEMCKNGWPGLCDHATY